MKSLFLAASLFLASIFGAHPQATSTPALATAAVANSQPSAPQALAVTSTALPSSTDATPVSFASNSNANVTQPTTPTANYVTQAALTAQINDLRALIASIAASTTTALTDPQIAANGNGVYYGEVSAPVTQLSNITVSNVSGLTASDIPALNYFPASSTIAIEYGGTGTSTRPTMNKLLLSDANGNWEYVATSSLGISGGGGGTLTSIGPSGQLQTGPTVTLATSTNTANGLTSALTITAAGNAITFAPSVSGTLTVAGGGTGWAAIQSGAIPYGSGTSALATTTAGTPSYVLAYLNGVPTWTATSTLANIAGTLAVASGGTGTSTVPTANRLLLSDANGNWEYVSTSSLGISGGGGSGIVGSGTQGQFSFYNTSGTTLSATSSIFISQSGNIEIGTSTPLAPLQVGNGTVNNSVDAQILVSRNVDNTISGNGHAFSDSSNITRGGIIGYNSYDARVTFSGSNNYDHYAAFQAAPVYESSGTMSNYYGLYNSLGLANSGTIDNIYGLYTGDSGGNGTVGNDYGVYVAALGSGTSSNFAIYTAGTTESYFGGSVGIGTTSPLAKLDVMVPSASSGIRLDNGSLTNRGWEFDPTTDSNGSTTDMSIFENALTTVPRMTFQSGGNVGIGNTNPQGKLDVGGAIYANTANDGILCDMSLGGNNSSYGSVGYNVRFGSSYTYCTSDTSSKLYFSAGGITFQTAPSGTAGNPITYTNAMSVLQSGNVGIGSNNSYSRLQVTGPDAASSTSAFAVVSSASTTVFSVFDGGNAQLSGTLTQSSDQRLKTNIQSLDASSTLALIAALNPVTFNWINPDQGNGTQVGFIAQQVQQIFPELVSTTSATALTPNGTLGLNYIGLISPLVSAIQALYADVQSLEQTVSSFAQSITSAVGNFGQVNTNDLCVGSTCVTPAQFLAIVEAANQSPSAPQQSQTGTSSLPESVTQNSASTTPATNPPIITINGDNPAIIQVGATYADLGATVSDTGTDQAGDTNLGLKTFLNGTLTSNIVIDTSQVATDTIDYVATDSAGLTATSTRTVIIEAATAATSTVQ